MRWRRAEVRASPVLPVADLSRSLDHYRTLGFLVSTHDDTYGFAALQGLELHLAVTSDPSAAVEIFLHVPDADALARSWAGTPVTSGPVDTPWGMREGRHVDPDGNVLRFGSR
jgi:catechol 2,3-dioxygenase-like lactoylglutathione lyase family enzyme